MNWDWRFAAQVTPEILHGLWTTVVATVSGSSIALLTGLVFTLVARSRSRRLAMISISMSEFIRRTPLLIQLYLLYFLLPFWGVTLPGLVCGVIALGLNAGAYLSQVYRAGIDGVARGQWEACTALNYGQRSTWLRIILPQAIPPMIPAIGNYVLLMFKDSALLSIIGVPELMSMARNIGNDSYRYLEPLTIVAAIYLALSLVTTIIIRRLEVRFGGQAFSVRE